MVFLQVVLFRKPWHHFCNKARRSERRDADFTENHQDGVALPRAPCPRLHQLLRRYWLCPPRAASSLARRSIGWSDLTLLDGRVIPLPVDTSTLVLMALALFGASLMRGVADLARTYTTDSLSQKVSYDLRNLLYDKLQHLSFAFHDTRTYRQSDVQGHR